MRILTGEDFVRLTTYHRTTIRIFDSTPESCWNHWIPSNHHAFPNANAGKGIGLFCSGFSTCPICEWNKNQREQDLNSKDLLRSRRLYTFNIIDRTQVLTCECGAEVYDIRGQGFQDTCKCGITLLDTVPRPRNKILLMQKGVTIYNQLEEFELNPDLGPVTEYDIIMDTRGKDQISTICIPKQKHSIDFDKVLGEDWESRKYDIKEASAPLDSHSVMRILNGDDYFDVIKDV